MSKRINIRLIFTIIVSLIEEAIILFIVIFVLSQFGIQVPLWLIITLALIFSVIAFIPYCALRKNPLLGFENMIGKSGLTVSPIARKGTVRIGRELWHAETDGENIEAGVEIIVVGQTGLKLTVVKKNQEELINQDTAL